MTEKSDTAFRTISEAADEIGVPAHVLRFWETRFSMLQPLKRAGGRRYYRPVDMSLLRQIKALLHDDGMTIRGAQLALAGKGAAAKDPAPPAPSPATMPGANRPGPDRQALIVIRNRLAAALAA
ncbi:MerR family transcriptional regulator [Sandarakinorhabdus limnophila]|uniref:MerR family transcriptional regulator n=1 Tax=Sandarakinorhabdus limnophila TaxID=210512 RepID=UPI0026EFFBA0|nr:MerR family transcriptional regulator [Sandarakinorhabdus limnophila]MCM0033478.1 MerR family transcriptional regulator [Sandarakinorhabdus limnophila]